MRKHVFQTIFMDATSCHRAAVFSLRVLWSSAVVSLRRSFITKGGRRLLRLNLSHVCRVKKRCADHRLHDPIDTCSQVTVNMFNWDAEKLDMISHLMERSQSEFFILLPFIQTRHNTSPSNFAWHMGESADWLKVKCEAGVELDLLIDRGQTVM